MFRWGWGSIYGEGYRFEGRGGFDTTSLAVRIFDVWFFYDVKKLWSSPLVRSLLSISVTLSLARSQTLTASLIAPPSAASLVYRARPLNQQSEKPTPREKLAPWL